LVNEEHLAILKKGIDVWNKWIQENPSIRPDLSGEDLSGEDLSNAYLNNANLTDTNLSYVNFAYTYLIEANCSNANLSHAILCGSVLVGATFTGANLSYVDLSNTDLKEAYFDDANLSNAKLYRAYLNKANLSKANLSKANLFKANLTEANLNKAILIESDLSKADLRKAKLIEADLSKANIIGAFLSEADFTEAYLIGANLSGSDIIRTKFIRANLSKTDIIGANLSEADLSQANLTNAHLNGSNMSGTILIHARLNEAILTDCRVFGVSAWGLLGLETAIQKDLIITPQDESEITVDNLEVAQFIYLILHNEKIRDVINTIGQKGVLILGRFGERKTILEALRKKLREIGYVPIIFDFTNPTDRDFTETVMTLAGMSRFIIADITQLKSVPLELKTIIPNYMIPMVTIIQKGERPFSMFKDLWIQYKDYVLEPLEYDSLEQLQRVFMNAVVDPANQRLELLRKQKAEEMCMRYAKDYEK
jgi:uncharacterized protein YjbI with pentapeptide repeats